MTLSDAVAKERADNATVFAAFHEQYVTKYIQLADAKAGATFTVCSGVFAYLWTRDTFIDAVVHARTWCLFAVSLGALILLAAGSAMAFYVIAPRLARSGNDLVFWKSVAALPRRDSLAEAVLTSSRERLARERLHHCYDLSKVCASKYLWLRRAMITGAVGLAAALFASFLSRLPPPASRDDCVYQAGLFRASQVGSGAVLSCATDPKRP
jgi:hypothetical protein